MTKLELGQTLVDRVNLFRGHTDGMWYETGQNTYMLAEFPNLALATMFSGQTIWTYQVQCEVSGGSWDDITQSAQVYIKPGLSAR